MEGQKYESTVLCFNSKKAVIESYVKNLNNNTLLKTSDEEFTYNNHSYEFPVNNNILPNKMKNSDDNYCYYYTYLSESDMTGVAVNKDYGYICFFDFDL